MHLRFDRLKIMDEAKAVSLNKKTGKYGSFFLLEFLFAAVIWIITHIGVSVSAVIGYWLADLFGLGGSDADNLSFAFILFGTVSSTVLMLLWGKIVSRRSMRTYGFVKKNALKHYLLGLLIGLGMFGTALLICILTGAGEMSVNPKGYNVFLLLALFVGFMIQGNEEEVLCRGHIFVSVTRRYSVIVGIIVNSLVFSGIHLFNNSVSILALINIFLFGLFMSMVFLRTGNIWMVSALHSMWNFAQGDIFGVSVSGNDIGETIFVTDSVDGMSIINGGGFGLEGGLAVTVVLAAAIVVAYFCKSSEGILSQEK